MPSSKPNSTKPIQPPSSKRPRIFSYSNVIINSIEQNPRKKHVGLEHWQDIVGGADISDKDTGGETPSTTAINNQKAPIRDDTSPSINIPDPPAQAVRRPTPNPQYTRPIYQVQTHNPTLTLSILRIAQRNLPCIDFASALNHLPCLGPKDPLPHLLPHASSRLSYYRRLPFANPQRCIAACEAANVSFLPGFYSDGRHALGYWTLRYEAFGMEDGEDEKTREERAVKMCLFTPCSNFDLERYGLVEYWNQPENVGADGSLDWQRIKAVGARGGKWLRSDVVGDWKMWRRGWRVVARVWETRLWYAGGGREDEEFGGRNW